MDHERNQRRFESVYSRKIRAGKRRTYFFDVRKTKGEDFYLTLTESTRKFNGDGYERHKIFLYKEDFNRFAASLNEVVNHVKTDLMPNFDYEEFDRRQAEWEAQNRDAEDEEMEEHAGPEDVADSAESEEGEEEHRKDAKERGKDDDEIAW